MHMTPVKELWYATVGAGSTLGESLGRKKFREPEPAFLDKITVGSGFLCHFAAGIVICQFQKAHC